MRFFVFAALVSLAAAVPLAQSLRNPRSAYTKAAQDDQITNLPGLGFEINFNQFAGYLDLPNTKKHAFYWFVEAQNDPSNAPVVLWTNGGPGCSGLIGFFTEHGPFRVLQNQTLELNPYAWNRNASILYVEQPAGVGFSYSDNKSDYVTGDAQAAKDNHQLILQFLARYPQLASNSFFITSESYGGHYMPTLALEIITNDSGAINFKGFMVGNPLTNMPENAHGTYDTMYGHQIVSKPTYDKWLASCNPDGKRALNCDAIEVQLNREAGQVNPYAIDYPVCNDASARAGRAQRVWLLNYIHAAKSHELKKSLGLIPPSDYQPCEDNYATDYLNTPAVKAAIHAKSTITWEECSNVVDYSQADVQTDMVPVYQKIFASGANLSIAVISGDDDTVCGTIGTQQWIWGVGKSVRKAWTSWYYEDAKYGSQIGGYVVKLQGITFATVHGAGHEVPAYRPAPALEIFNQYLQGTLTA